MTMRSTMPLFVAGLATVGCAKHGTSTSASAHDASPADRNASASDARPNANDVGRATPDSARADPDTSPPDVDNNWTLPHSDGPVWRNSTVPYCGSDDGWQGDVGDLWSDSRGVYLIRTVPTNYGLLFNSGSGWSRVSPQPSVQQSDLRYLSGIPGGPLLLYGEGDCGVTAFDGQTTSCLATVTDVTNVFAAAAQRVFAIVGDNLLTLDGSYFTLYGNIPTVQSQNYYPSYQLWADGQVAVVAANAGNVYLFDSSATVPQLLATPDGMVVESLWGFGPDDLWIGDDRGRLAHYDGDSWTVQQVAHGNCLNISQMWGAEHVLYFATESYVGRWGNGKLDTVLDGPCVQNPETPGGTYEQVIVEKIWGNSPTELFIALFECKETVIPVGSNGARFSDVGPDACGQYRLYWFDGQKLGRL